MVVERNHGHVDDFAGRLLDELEAVVDDGEGRQAEEVHLQKAHLFDGLHVVGGDDGFVLGAGDGDEFGERLGRDDDACGVDAGAAYEAFEAHRGVDQFLDLGVGVVGGGERTFVFERFVDGDADGRRDHLGDAVDLAVGHLERAAYVLDGGLCGHRVEGDDLRDLIVAVRALDVLDDLAATVHAEVDVDIRHRDALGVEEALEEQLVLERIDVGDLHDVGDKRSGGRATAGAYRDSLLFGVTDKVPHNHEIAGKLHLFDAV